MNTPQSWASWPAHPAEVPQGVELPPDLGWAMWDEAKQAQDSGFMSLEPTPEDTVRDTLSPRSAFRAEVTL